MILPSSMELVSSPGGQWWLWCRRCDSSIQVQGQDPTEIGRAAEDHDCEAEESADDRQN